MVCSDDGVKDQNMDDIWHVCMSAVPRAQVKVHGQLAS